MLIKQTEEQLRTLRLNAMLEQWIVIRENPKLRPDTFDDYLGILVDAQLQHNIHKKILRRQTTAKLKHKGACIEDIDYVSKRKMDIEIMRALVTCQWVDLHQNLLIEGPTGIGKSWIACAIGNQAIRQDKLVVYKRLSRLLEELERARGEGVLPEFRMKLAKADLLILDDWAIEPITRKGRSDLLEVIEDQTGSGSIMITSQLPVNKWHAFIGEATIADAILDRIVHNAHHLQLDGPSMRKKNGLLKEKL